MTEICDKWWDNFYGLMQERRNSIVKALELRLSYIHPSIWSWIYMQKKRYAGIW